MKADEAGVFSLMSLPPVMTSTSWQIQAQHFLMPKGGHDLSECEDALGLNPEAFRYAIADGATEAFDSKSWARQLAQQWVQDEPPALTIEDFRSWVAQQGQRLHSSWDGLQLSWYAQEKAGSGSFAAFVGVQFDLQDDPASWRAIALGDCCLVQRNEDEIRTALPFADYRSFNASPLLIPSLERLQAAVLGRVVVGSGPINAGDSFLLLSDAVAAWYLMLCQRQDPARAEFESLLAADRNEDLSRFFDEERLAGRLKNDDIAIIRIAFARP